jgi:hypothetical protein
MEQLSGLETRRDEKKDGTIEWFRNETRRDETRRDETRKTMEQLSGLETRRDETKSKQVYFAYKPKLLLLSFL